TAEAGSASRVGTRASVRFIAIPPSKLARGRRPAAAGDRDEQAAARQRISAHVHDPVVAEVLALERQDERGAEGRKTDRGAGDGAARERRPGYGGKRITRVVQWTGDRGDHTVRHVEL